MRHKYSLSRRMSSIKVLRSFCMRNVSNFEFPSTSSESLAPSNSSNLFNSLFSAGRHSIGSLDNQSFPARKCQPLPLSKLLHQRTFTPASQTNNIGVPKWLLRIPSSQLLQLQPRRWKPHHSRESPHTLKYFSIANLIQGIHRMS